MNPRFVALMFHRIIDPPESKFDITPRLLETLLRWLRDEGYTVDGFSGMRRRLADGTVPARYALFTFDDGHLSNLGAAETLARFGAGATFFVLKPTAKLVGFANAAEVRQMAEHVDIGSHGVTHREMARVPIAEAKAELADSKAWIEDTLGRRIESFSFPHGSYNRAVLDAAREVGYELVGCSKEWWNEGAKVESSGVVNRVVFGPDDDVAMLKRLVEIHGGEYSRRRLRYELVRSLTSHLPAPVSDFIMQVKEYPGKLRANVRKPA